MVKGSGMIHPNMATMLCFLTTDAAIPQFLLDASLQRAVRRSFNRLTVDGDTSTNDTVIIMANGMAAGKEGSGEWGGGNTALGSGGRIRAPGSAEYEIFADALEKCCISLARAMARDGEGASKLVTVTVSGAADEKTAETLAKSVAASSLVKAACFGADANWGRILCAMGYSGAEFDQDKTDVRFKSRAGEILVCSGGASVPFSEENAKQILSEEEIEILIDVSGGGQTGGTGKTTATAWGCDLTYDYVKINGDYRS
jgi:glutamate N-acetyltransferase/amino-acid N-acetyltransferase